MLSRIIDDIRSGDLLRLIKNRVAEDKGIEYKRELRGGADKEKIAFLRAVSSFANTSGGDLLYGVEARDGIPVGLSGLENPNEDEVKQRLENLLRDGVEPRIPGVQFRFVPHDQERSVLVIRASKSWNAPHRVKLAGHAHFYGRNSAGAYQLDVGELRTAFTAAESMAERIRAYRADRLIKLGSEQTPVPIVKSGTMVFHLLPLASFASFAPSRIALDNNERNAFQPIGASGCSSNVNLEAYVLFTDRGQKSSAYTQIYRSGIIESVAVFEPWERGAFLPASWIERELIQALRRYTLTLKAKGVEPPFVLSLSFLNVKGYQLATSDRWMRRNDTLTDRDSLILPEIEIEQVEFDSATALRPLFDMLWNAFGYESCQSYDENGVWKEK